VGVSPVGRKRSIGWSLGGRRALAGVGDPPGRASCPVSGGTRTPARDGVLGRVIAHGVDGGVWRLLLPVTCGDALSCTDRVINGVRDGGATLLVPDKGSVIAPHGQLSQHRLHGLAMPIALVGVGRSLAVQRVTQ
jgi:hypothetical protein